MGSWGPKGPILVPYGTLVFLLIFSSKLAAMSLDELILARRHLFMGLNSLMWGPNEPLGSQGPYFGPMWNMAFLLTFSSKIITTSKQTHSRTHLPYM